MKITITRNIITLTEKGVVVNTYPLTRENLYRLYNDAHNRKASYEMAEATATEQLMKVEDLLNKSIRKIENLTIMIASSTCALDRRGLSNNCFELESEKQRSSSIAGRMQGMSELLDSFMVAREDEEKNIALLTSELCKIMN